MILQSLVDYYGILDKSGSAPRLGYSSTKVSFALEITSTGELSAVIPLKQTVQRGKKMKEIPQTLVVPEHKKRSSNLTANLLCDNQAYTLGIPAAAGKHDTEEDIKRAAEYAVKRFRCYKKLHHTILDEVDCTAARAVLIFLDNWNPEEVNNIPAVFSQLKELRKGGNIVFSMEGKYAHDDPSIQKAWKIYHESEAIEKQMQCLITGESAPIAVLHPSIQGIRGGQSTGVSLVSFNDDSDESFGHIRKDKTGQGYNAPVSKYAAFAYGAALNHLLADDKSNQYFGDTTVVYWALSPKKIYRDLFAFSLDPEIQREKKSQETDLTEDKKTAKLLQDIFVKLVEGKPIADFSSVIDEKTRFFILGLSPNASRASVRFFLRNNFGSVIQNVMLHYHQLEIEHSPKDFAYLPLWKLMLETVSPSSKDKASSPLLSGSVLRSIFTGEPYPTALLNSVLIRVHAGDEISRGKAAIIKAYLSRSSIDEKNKEVLTVSLNEKSDNKAYVLGRLFSALEKAQLDANPGIKTTIVDRFFSSACATPRSVFPTLLRMAFYYMTKSEYGTTSRIRIDALMQKLDVDKDPFPAHLSLLEQGIFILGYYHQNNANYAKKDQTINKDKSS